MSTLKKVALTLLATALPCFAWGADKWAAWEPLAFSAATTSSTQGGINGSVWVLQNNNGSSTITDGVMSVVASSAAPCVDMTAVNTFGTTNPLTLVATVALTETSGSTMPIITFDGWKETMTFVLCATSVSEADGATLTLQYRDHAQDVLNGDYTTHSETVVLPEATPGTDVTLSIFLSSAGVQLFTLADDVATLRKTWDVADDAAQFNRVTFGGYHGGNATYAYSMKSLAFYRNTDATTSIFPTVVTIDSAALRFGEATDEAGDPTAARLSERSDRSMKTATPAEGVEVKQYTKELASGGEYTRTLVTYTNNSGLNLPLAGLEVKDATLFAAGATTLEKVGNTDGAVIAARTGEGAQAWFAVEHPFTRYTLPDAASTQLRKTLSFDTAKTTYTVADLSNVSKPTSNHGVGMGVLYIPITVDAEQTSVTLTLQYANIGNGNGSWAALFGDVDIYDASGFFVKTHTQEVTKTGSSGTYTTTIEGLTAGATYLLAVQSGADYDDWGSSGGTSDGNITLTNATAVAGDYTLFLDKTASAETYMSLPSRGTTDASSTTKTYNHDDITDHFLEVPIKITDPDNVQLTVKYISGSSRIDIGGLKLYTETGLLVKSIEHSGYAGNPNSNNVISIANLPASYEGEVLIAVFTLWAGGGTNGTIVCSGAEPTTGFLPKRQIPCAPAKTSYALADLQNVNNSSATEFGHGIIDVPVKVLAQDFSVTMTYSKGGNNRAEIFKVELIDGVSGEVLETKDYIGGEDWSSYNQPSTASTGSSHYNNEQEFTGYSELVGGYALVRFYAGVEKNASSSWGTFSASGATLSDAYFMDLPEYDPITAVVPLEEKTLAPGESITFSYVTGQADDPEQFRRVYNEYLNAERAHPHRVLPHYNSWYDLCINRNGNAVSGRFTEAEALASMQAFREELWEKRGVSIDSYLWDDGWDEWYSFWDFNANFPQGFTNLADEAHKVPGASIAAWLSPLGGYGASNTQRVKYVTDQGYSYSLADDVFYAAFRNRVIQMITDYDMNLFKFDRMGTGGDATAVADGYNPQLTAVGNLCAEMRVAKPDVFINATVGTWASPYWLMWADSIWRGGNDVGHEGAGTSRQKWITYRDNIMYDRIVAPGNLLPLNSMMMHGIVVCPSTGTSVDLQASTSTTVDFASEVWMGMTLGTGLQEYYITPSLMSEEWWDILAKGIKFLKANEAIFTDAHWIGGDPSAGIYGYASLGDRKGIVTLRNPTSGELTIKDSLDAWLEMPEALKGRNFTFTPVFNSTTEYDATGTAFALPEPATTADAVDWTLPAYATVVFEVNFENTNEVVIDANTYETFSAWKSAWMTENEIAEDGFALAIFQKDVILDFGNITEAKTFTFDEGLSTMGKLYIAGNQSATGTIALADGVSVAAMGGTLIETQVIVPPALLNSLDDPNQVGVKGGVEIGPSAVVSINVVAGQTGTLTAVPTGSGELIKVGMGTLELAGGIYVQPITVKQGVISVAAASQFIEMVAVNKFMTLQADAETTFSGLVVLNGTLTANAATSFDRNLSVSTSATINGTTAITQNCNVQVSAGATLTVETPVVLECAITKSGAGEVAYNGLISGAYDIAVNAGTMTLSAVNSYATTTVNSNATLVVNGASDTKVLPEGKAVTVNAGGTINLVRGLSFVNISGEGQTVVSGTYDFGISGSFATGISTKRLHIEETGTLQIRAWQAYTFNVKELIVDGTMQKDPDNGTKTPSVTVPGTGTLSGTGTLELPLTLAAGATIDAQEGAVTVTGTVTQSGALTVDVTGLAAGAPILTCATTNLNLEQMTATGLGAGLLLVKNDTVLSVAKAVTEREVGTYDAIVEAIADITAAHQDASLILTDDIDLGETTLVIDAGEGNTVTINLNQRMISASVPVIRIESGTLKLVAVEGGSNTVKSTAATAIVVGADADGNAVAEACALDIGAGVVVSTEASLPAVNVVSGAISGAGTIPGELTLAAGATIDTTAGTQVTAMTVSTLPATLTVKVAALPVEGTPVDVVKLAYAFASDTSLINNLSVVVGEKTYTTGYKFVMTDSGYAVAADPICRIGSTGYPTLEDALATIDTTGDELVETTIALTKDLTLDETVVVNVGSALQNNKRYGNTLVIDLAGHTITSTANPAFLVECGILKFESSTAASVSATGAGPAVVVGTGDSTKAYTGLRVDANVTVTSAIDTSVAVVVGHIGGAGTITGLNLADETVVDISEGDLLTVTGTLVFPPQVETAGELQNGRVDIYLPESATFPAPFVNFTGATQAAADKVNTYGKHPGDTHASYNFAPVLTRDNTTGDISGYAIMQYTWIAKSGELYTTIAEAYADGATELTQYENTSEYITVPAGVIVNSLGFTINGNVTVQNGGKYVSYGTINGNLVLEAGSEIDISMNLDYTDETGTWELMVNGDVIFPEGDTIAEGENAGKPNSETVEVTITVGESKSEATLGNPLVLIHSPNGTPGDIADGVTMAIVYSSGEGGTVIDDYHVVRTSEYYMLSTYDTGACNYDGIEYASIAAALADYTVKSNQTIKLNETVELTETIVIDVGEGNTVTMDLTGYGITSSADPAIRIESGNLALLNNGTDPTMVMAATGTAVLVGANANGSASAEDAAFYVGEGVTVLTYGTGVSAVDVVSGTLAGEGTITGELKLGEGATVDATYGILTAGSVDFPYTSVTEGETTTYTNGTIYVVPPAGEAYPAQFIACTAATADAKAYTNVKVILNGEEATDAAFSIEVKYADDQTTVTGYAVDGDGWAAMAVVDSSMTYHKEFAAAVAEAGASGTVILLADVTIAGELSTNIYTNGHNVTINEAHTLTGTLTLTHGTEVTANDTLTATSVVVEANATVTLNGYISAPIVNNGTLAGMGMITGTLRLANGATVAGTCAPTGGTTIDEGATVSITGTLTGNLTAPNVTINGNGHIYINEGNILAGAGTITPTVHFTDGAIIDKVGYEATHFVINNLNPLTNEVITVKAKTLANVMNTKSTVVSADNFVLSMADGSVYEAYDGTQDSGTNLVIPTVAVNGSDYTVGIVKFNLALAGVPLGEDAVRMASYAYRQGILEVKGVYNNVDAYQLFTNVGTGFTSAGYVMVDYDFGITDVTVIDNNGTKYIVVTADVDGVNDKTEGDLSGNAGYREGTTVTLLDGEGTAVEGAVELTAGNAEDYGLTYTEQAGVKWLIVELPDAPTDGSETLKFTVKATKEVTE